MATQQQTQPQLGQSIQTPWWAGAFTVTQQWGPTDYDGEPEGHGYLHWHAGIDTGLACGTTLMLPHGVAAVARPFLNPGGYGTALKLEVGSSPGIDIILGHLRQILVAPGQQLLGGEQLAVSNNSGNSSGCHLHFEVRPRGGSYGTDTDPTGWLLNPNGEGVTQPYTTPPAGTQPGTVQLGFGPADAISNAIGAFGQQLVAQAQMLLGLALMLGGALVLFHGLRGSSPVQAAQSLATAASRRPPAQRSLGASQAQQQALRVQQQALRVQQAEQLHAQRLAQAEQLHAQRLAQSRAKTRIARARARQAEGKAPRTGRPRAGGSGVFVGGQPVDVSGWSPEAQTMVSEAQLSRLRPNLQGAARAPR